MLQELYFGCVFLVRLVGHRSMIFRIVAMNCNVDFNYVSFLYCPRILTIMLKQFMCANITDQ